MRKLTIAIALLVAVAVIGTVAMRIGKTGPDHSSRSASGSNLAAEPNTASTDAAAGSELAAARQAAIDAVAATPAVVKAGFISRRDLIASFATASYAPQLADDTSAQMDELLVQVGQDDVDAGSMELAERPITAAATTTPDGVQVQVWSVLIIAVPGTGPARQVWRTVTVQMRLDGGRWLVDDWKSTLGPTPSPAADATFEDASTFTGPLEWDAADVDRAVR
ncbi:MAG: hypothetical protein JWL72_1425 [Ilumatobacteraceae bacterium]|nr:hypothetical protein [Ilumatobacteraceae bacterium]MCU1388087.1 hypothetical protein [Ilumatobacteraceae bacterium]